MSSAMALALPPRLLALSASNDEARAWLARLPSDVAELGDRWQLSFDPGQGGGDNATCSFIAFVHRADGTPAVLKLGLPHMEAEQEGPGLSFWNGDAMIQLLASDDKTGALLLERCDPGTPLSERPEPEQDDVMVSLLLRLWRVPPNPRAFRPLEVMVQYWADCALSRRGDWPDAGVASAGLELLLELGRPVPRDVLLATDLHAGNVLRARREPWLAIDPKPFFGDPAFDVTQHLLNCTARLAAEPRQTVSSLAMRLGVSSERVRQWLFARLATHTHLGAKTFGLEPGDAVALARRLEKGLD